MNRFNKLIDIIKESPEINRFKELENSLKDNEEYKKQIKKLHSMQKKIVNVSSQGLDIKSIKNEYADYYNEIVSNPLIDEYLELKERINILLVDIQDIFNENL